MKDGSSALLFSWVSVAVLHVGRDSVVFSNPGLQKTLLRGDFLRGLMSVFLKLKTDGTASLIYSLP